MSSHSRVGRYDFGVNRRRIRKYLRRLQKSMVRPLSRTALGGGAECILRNRLTFASKRGWQWIANDPSEATIRCRLEKCRRIAHTPTTHPTHC
jgi:hypothetical protein